MGEDIPATLDYETGLNCLSCFAAGWTPKYIYVKFSDVILCPGKAWPGGVSLNTTWKLPQIAACQWRYTDVNWLIDWLNFVAGPWTTCIAYLAGTNNRYFSARQAPICLTYIENDYPTCLANPWHLSHSGFADMSIYN